MLHSFLTRGAAWTVPAALLVAPLAADTIVVDDNGGPGVDYLDIPPAVQAANPGDLILVHPGSYSGFTVNKELTVLGTPGAFTGDVLVVGSSGAGPVVLSTLYAAEIWVLNCADVVVLEDVFVGAAYDCLRITQCADVRVRGSAFGSSSAQPWGGNAVEVGFSRAEFVECTVWGPGGPCPDHSGWPGSGLKANYSDVHFALSSAIGLNGMHYSWCSSHLNIGGGGGDGLSAYQSNLLVSGLPSNVLRAGFGGYKYGDCGYAVSMDVGSSSRISGVTLEAGGSPLGGMCKPIAANGPVVSPDFTDPTLEVWGHAVPGALLPFRVNAPVAIMSTSAPVPLIPAAEAWLLLGWDAVITPMPGDGEDRLTSEDRAIVLGTVLPGGVIEGDLRIPTSLPTGTIFYAQAFLSYANGGEPRLSHSVPILVK